MFVSPQQITLPLVGEGGNSAGQLYVRDHGSAGGNCDRVARAGYEVRYLMPASSSALCYFLV